MIKTLVFLLLLIGNKEERVLNDIKSKQSVIAQAASTMLISPRTVASVIYAERLLNYNWEDKILDDVTVRVGYNSSIGFAQIKITTAFWIEEELHKPYGHYYLGKEIEQRFPRSRTREELINRLINDSTNIQYGAAYLAMIRMRWTNTGFCFAENNEAGMLGTLYCLGILKNNDKERLPNANASTNDFGKTAQAFYDSFTLRKEF